ncbi:GNAT family N-acetyltransferase [Streptomyces sp. NPDC060209]|uniref:GNAT family N-acetyltransferase n=1 Tax=Streptomyces sp. NPDC060209 TaxID=3347073 RepID=UPI00365A6949
MEEPAEILSHDQVELRRWRTSDLDALQEAISGSLEHLIPWMPWAATHDREQGAAFLARNQEEWESGHAFGYAITSDATVIGSCGLFRRIGAGGLDIGYWLHPRWTGRGLATTAATALVEQGFQLAGIDRMEIHHDAANPASGAVAHRLGFMEAGRGPAPEGPAAPGEVGIDVVWRITAAQWEARTAARIGTGELR